MDDSILRIRRMEGIFDALLSAKPGDARYFPDLKELTEYYESPVWRKDYEADEAGLLPKELKRGVLSQDGVYNLLSLWAEEQKA